MREAKYRREVFRNLQEYLKKIYRVVSMLDGDAEVYLFGSVAEGRSLYSSDIDILVVSKLPPSVIMDELWRAGVKDPFEIHVVGRDKLELYRKRSKLVPVNEKTV